MKHSCSDLIELSINSKPMQFYFDYILCKNPECDCNGVNIYLSSGALRVSFFLDFKTESYRDNGYSPEEAIVIKAFIEFVKHPKNRMYNLNYFKKWYEIIKSTAKRRKKMIESFKPGTMMPYSDIFSDESMLKVGAGGKNYIVDDYYCVMPDCACSEAMLNFFEDTKEEVQKMPDFSFVYDYADGRTKELNGLLESDAKLIAYSLGKKLKGRHAKLKRSVRKDVLRKVEAYRNIIHAISYADRKKPMSVTPIGGSSGPTRKLGRNEPCHCGSGKKYKKCCLDKDLEEKGAAARVEA